MSFPVTLDEIFSFELNLENSFIAAMVAQGISPTPQPSFVLTQFDTPYISVWFQNGAANRDNQHSQAGFPGRLSPFNTYGGILSVMVATNRSGNVNHKLLVAQCRKTLQMWNLYNNWDAQQIDYPTECRESGSQYEYDDEKLLDFTTLNFDVLHSINPAAWPTIALNT